VAGNHLGAMLLTSRIAHGWSLRDAGRHSGVPNAHISQIETGAIRKPSPQTLGKLAIGYSLPLRELLDAAGYTEEQNAMSAGQEARIRVGERERLKELLGERFKVVLAWPANGYLVDAVPWSSLLDVLGPGGHLFENAGKNGSEGGE
jgi:transcriptional regulator with XRE-family HTH domain